MLIQLLNPNTSDSMTNAMTLNAQRIALPSTQIKGYSALHGPQSIECSRDEIIASAALLDQVEKGNHDGVDAHIIACFGDPALEAAREISHAPVIGIAEAAFQLASIISYRFGVVTTLERTLPASEHLLQKYGYQQHCSGVRATNIPVLDLDKQSSGVFEQLKKECEKAIQEDGAEAIVLGCAGMSEITAKLQSALSVPIIDGVSAAVKWAEGIHHLGLKTSKVGHYGTPVKKAYTGRYSHWS